MHARPSAGAQTNETKAGTEEAPRAEEGPMPTGVRSATTTGRSNKRPIVADSAPEREKRRKLEGSEDGETTEEDEQVATTADLNVSDRNGSDRNGSDQIGSDQNGSDKEEADHVKSDRDGSNGGGSDENGEDGGGGSSDPGPLLNPGDAETSILVTCGRNDGRLYLSKLRVVVNERCRSKCIRTGNTWWTPNEFQFVSGRGAAKDWKRTVKHAGQCLKTLLVNGTLSLATSPPRCLCDSCTAQVSLSNTTTTGTDQKINFLNLALRNRLNSINLVRGS